MFLLSLQPLFILVSLFEPPHVGALLIEGLRNGRGDCEMSYWIEVDAGW